MRIYNFPYKSSPYEVFLRKGIYKFEAWGAAGGFGECNRSDFERKGRGAYVSGVIHLKEATTFHVYVGEEGGYKRTSFNGNLDSNNACLGGGATDYRLTKGSNWSDIKCLKSRIMVAAGGG